MITQELQRGEKKCMIIQSKESENMELAMMITIANAAFVILMIVLMMIGYKNGLILSLINCVGWIVAFLAAYMFSPAASRILTLYPLALTPMNDTAFGAVFQQMFNQLVWFVLIAAVVKLVCLFLKPIAKVFCNVPVLGFFNKVAGAAFGIVNMWIWTSIICMVLQLPAFEWGKDVIDGSLLKSASLVTDLITDQIDVSDEDINELMMMVENIKNLDDETINEIREKLEEFGITQAQIDRMFENLE